MDEQKINNRKISDQELLQYFESTLPIEQHRKVEAWISSSEENMNLAKNIYTITLAKDVFKTIKEIEPEKAFAKTNKKIRQHKLNFFLKWSQRTAAILFIPLFILTTILLSNEWGKESEHISFRTNPGIIADFNLPDGSKVWLNARSTLKYPARFNRKVREVELEGEAFFDIKSDIKHPFKVKINDEISLEVTGTEFNIDAYNKDTAITTTLVSGAIKLNYLNRIKQKDTKTLNVGEKIILDRKTGTIEQIKASPLVETGWKDGMIFLEDTPIEHLLHTLSKRFDVEFVLQDQKLKKNHFTGTFASQDLSLILKHLEISSNIQHKTETFERNSTDKDMIITLF